MYIVITIRCRYWAKRCNAIGIWIYDHARTNSLIIREKQTMSYAFTTSIT